VGLCCCCCWSWWRAFDRWDEYCTRQWKADYRMTRQLASQLTSSYRCSKPMSQKRCVQLFIMLILSLQC